MFIANRNIYTRIDPLHADYAIQLGPQPDMVIHDDVTASCLGMLCDIRVSELKFWPNPDTLLYYL